MSFRRTLLPLLAAALLLTACGSGSKHQAAPTNESTTTTTTIDVRSRQVPDHPDAAYVSAVMKELEHVRGDIRRDVFSTQSYTQADEDRIDDIYSGDVIVKQARLLWQNASMKPHPEAVAIPGDDKMINITIFDTQPGCVVFKADADINSVVTSPPPSLPQMVFQINTFPKDNRTNPTPWKMTVESSFDASMQSQYTCAS